MVTDADRKTGPDFQVLGKAEFMPVGGFSLPNGIEVSLLEGGSQDISKIDWIFPAGAVQAGKPLLASTVGNLMLEGTKNRTSAEISDLIDFYGAHLNVQSYYHNSVLTLVCLTKDLPVLLPLVEDVVRNATFDEKEYLIYINKRRQEFVIDSEKVRNLAARTFNKVIFGPEHPYGRVPELEIFDSMTRDEVISFYKTNYVPAGCRIIVAGRPGTDIQELLTRHFGDKDWNGGLPSENGFPQISSSEEKFHLVEKEGSLQSALRIGRPLFNNHHPDFIPLQVLNTILGGYFGSRLMTVVREEKGLTYGIGSSIVSYKQGGIWVIASEVMGDMRQAAVDAIKGEMQRLVDEPVDEEELALVRNYMLGEMLREFDGPFNTSDIYRSLLEYGMDFGFYSKMMSVIREITAGELQELAAKYMRPEDFYVIVAGK